MNPLQVLQLIPIVSKLVREVKAADADGKVTPAEVLRIVAHGLVGVGRFLLPILPPKARPLVDELLQVIPEIGDLVSDWGLPNVRHALDSLRKR